MNVGLLGYFRLLIFKIRRSPSFLAFAHFYEFLESLKGRDYVGGYHLGTPNDMPSY